MHVDADGLFLVDVVFDGNDSRDDGGGLDLRGDDATLDRVVFHDNTSAEGGGMRLDGDDARFTNVTFADNEASSRGGGLYAKDDTSLLSSSFVGNRAPGQGAALDADGEEVTLSNTLFAGNTASGDGSVSGVDGKVVSNGYNLFERPNYESGDFDLRGAPGPDLVSTRPPGDIARIVTDGDGRFVRIDLPVNSPAIDAGASAASDVDADGQSRDALPDVGAHESGAPAEVVFWADEDGRIWRAGIDLQDPQYVADRGAASPEDLEVDAVNGRLYWLEQGGARLAWTTLDGIGGVSSQPVGFDVSGIAVDVAGQRLYAAGPGRLVELDISGGSPTNGTNLDEVAMGLVDPGDLAFDAAASRLVWVERSGAVRSASPTGAPNVRDEGQAAPGRVHAGIAVDPASDRRYLVDPVADRLEVSSELDGPLPEATVDGRDVAYGGITDTVVVADTMGFTTLRGDMTSQGAVPIPGSAPVTVAIAATPGEDPAPTIADRPAIVVSTGQTESLAPDFLAATDAAYADSDRLIWTLEREPDEGVLEITGPGVTTSPTGQIRFTQASLEQGRVAIEYTAGTAAGAQTFEFSVTDGVNAPQSRTYDIDVTGPPNAPPTVITRPVELTEGGSMSLPGDAIEGADPDGDALTYTVTPSNGMYLSLSENGPEHATFTEAELGGPVWVVYTGELAEGATDTANLTVTASDGREGSSTETLAVTIAGTNDAPSITAGAVDVIEDGSAALPAGAIDASDAEGDAIVYTIAPAGGVHLALAEGGEARTEFTEAELAAGLWVVHDGELAPGERRTVALEVAAGDGADASSATLEVTVIGRNDAPTLALGTVSLVEDGSAPLDTSIVVGADEETVDPDALVYTVSAPDGRTLSVFTQTDLAAGRVVLVDDTDDADLDPVDLSVTLTDAGGASTTGTLTVTFVPVNDAPIVGPLGTVPVLEHGEGRDRRQVPRRRGRGHRRCAAGVHRARGGSAHPGSSGAARRRRHRDLGRHVHPRRRGERTPRLRAGPPRSGRAGRRVHLRGARHGGPGPRRHRTGAHPRDRHREPRRPRCGSSRARRRSSWRRTAARSSASTGSGSSTTTPPATTPGSSTRCPARRRAAT